MKPNDNRLYIYPNYNIELVIVDPHMDTGELDYEWQAKLVMHEVISKPLSLTQYAFAKMLTEAILGKEANYNDYLNTFSRLLNCLSDAWKEVHNTLGTANKELKNE